MNVITPTVEIWKQENGIDGMWKHIARCTRVCYQSERKKSVDESDRDFVERVIFHEKPNHSEANHLSVLEHGTVYLTIPSKDIGLEGRADYYLMETLLHNRYSKHKYEYENGILTKYHITTNMRVLIENGLIQALKYIVCPTDYHYPRVTVSFTTNIGISRETNRHRASSPSEESTRYCNYKGNLNICPPAWMGEENDLSDVPVEGFARDMCVQRIDNMWDAWDYYWFALKAAEFSYNNLIRLGWKPQQAREVLPLATKTQVVYTAFVEDWERFFRLRGKGISGAPHPNLKPLVLTLEKIFKDNGYTS